MMDRRGVREGMVVHSSDGEKLGKVVACESETFIIEKGFFFPKDYIARYADISDVSGDEIRLASTKDALREGSESYAEDRPIPGDGAFGESARAISGTDRDLRETGQREVGVTLAEDQVDVTKRPRDAGEVRLHKDVVTEQKRIDVPVTREEVRVEHVRAGDRPAAPGAFEEKTVTMPVQEEEVEIRKRPVIKEEVRLRKDQVVEQRASDVDVRSERVDIEDQGTRSIRDTDDDLER